MHVLVSVIIIIIYTGLSCDSVVIAIIRKLNNIDYIYRYEYYVGSVPILMHKNVVKGKKGELSTTYWVLMKN